MTAFRILSIRGLLAALHHRFGRNILADPIGRTPDRIIDRLLSELGQTRSDLFTPKGARARHRVRMAHMLAAYRVDVPRAVEEHWEQLKAADNYCHYCPDPTRCQHWLERPWHEEAPKVFCPNETLFSAIASGQAKQPERTA